MKFLIEYIKDCIRRKFYGTLVISFRDGKIIKFVKEESFDIENFNDGW